MSRLPLVLAFALGTLPALAQSVPVTDWQLLAIDGVLTDIPATLSLTADGSLAGKAPCNNWSANNAATLPALDLKGIRATRMACDRLADEQRFFDTLSAMTTLAFDGETNLILTAPDGRSLEFVPQLTVCKTCAAKD